ncbi:MAG: hypothetical protein RJB66_1184 [Pseudomonadota bacterium]|jgi:hypothetical protein
MTPKILKIELIQLIEFGLNPFQWIPIEEGDRGVELIHIDDPELKVIAKMESHTQKSAKITHLEWIL